MPQLTEQGRQRIDELAQRYSESTDAVMALLQALVNSNGTMAQFNHPELGGNGQWMLGGMTMVGDMFKYGLKAKVDGLCSELSQLLAQQPFVPVQAGFQSQSQGGGQQPSGNVSAASISLFVPEPPGRASGQWWPAELGSPPKSARPHIAGSQRCRLFSLNQEPRRRPGGGGGGGLGGRGGGGFGLDGSAMTMLLSLPKWVHLHTRRR